MLGESWESAADAAFRAEVRDWLAVRLAGPHAAAKGAGGPGREGEAVEARRAWERELGAGGWIGIGWPPSASYAPSASDDPGGRRVSLSQQVVWAEEYARADAPARVGHIGENLLAPTLLTHGTPAQQDRFLSGVARGEVLWCQGYSEPGAGSDLAGIRTTAVRDGGGRGAGAYRVTGQKVWTSLAREADWCFVLARTDPAASGHRGLSFLLVPMDQAAAGRIEVRPIRQMSGTSEFNEVFFDGAIAEEVVGGEGNGWAVATSLLGLERGVSTLAQQVGFQRELSALLAAAGPSLDPELRSRLVRLWSELHVMRWNALRTLGSSARTDPGAPSVAKLLWGGWHQRLGELAMQIRGAAATVGEGVWDGSYQLPALQAQFLFSRADTIYGGSDEIQRNIIAERVLGLPRETRGSR
ncbi:acyl-CoA dehydrogenase family protein [Streptomyces sp. NPDC091272]|uniref:acyl-CoA dehydrogenase family protein n=1 Tax=Streptomyces sp. NPDC091272 TaxID=3365981 RepID=UPI003805A777